jgi:hypothetical protein
VLKNTKEKLTFNLKRIISEKNIFKIQNFGTSKRNRLKIVYVSLSHELCSSIMYDCGILKVERLVCS